VINTIAFTLLLVISFGLFIYSMRNIISYLKIGKPENRLNSIKQRIINTINIAFLQSRLFRSKFAGLLHASIFWGFCVLLLLVIEGFIEGYIHNFSFAFLGKFYSLITITQDVFGYLVLITVTFSLFRRYIGTPKRLKDKSSRPDATLILILIMLVMITMIGMNIEKTLLGTVRGARPITSYFAWLINSEGSETVYQIFWWTHNIVVLGFLNYLPYSKHFHVISSIPNTFLSNFKIDKKNILKPINFEDESIQQYGAKDIEDLTWKQLLNGYTCTECGRCTEVCPANGTGKLLNPKKIITDIRKRTMQKGPLVLKKIENNPILEKSLVHDYITKEELWACTTCAACVEECPVMIDHITSIVELRRNLTMMESSFPPEVNTVFRNLENNESPWAFGAESRNEWIEEFLDESEKENIKSSLVKLSNAGTANELDIVFWVGCAGAFDKRYRNVTKSFAKILSKAGIKFGVLGSEEKCNGDTARRLGNEFLAQQFITQNIETFKKYNIKKIVTTCPHCLHSLKNEYPAFGIELDVVHHSDFISKLFKDKKIVSSRLNNEKLTYHDSCYLGRYNDIYDSPRKIIEESTSEKLIEMKRSRDKGFCCGAGGGRMFMEETEGKRVNIERTEEALSTNATTICSACPFCMTMLSDGIKAKEKADDVKVKDIAELVIENLK
jgi:Fe-S oxidoreductase